MLWNLCRRIVSQWTWFAKCASQAWKTVLAPLIKNLVARQDVSLSTLNPLTAEQLDRLTAEFVSAIDVEAVRALASSYNNGAPCRIDSKETTQGSFNVCFFARFDSHVWVVRVPIQPVLHDAWGKLQSEVCTMLYIHENTKIPVPRVHAFGQARLLHNDPTQQAFMILDYIDGRPLSKKSLSISPKENRVKLYSELIEILLQLRQLEFATGGSLMPGSPERGSSEPTVVGALSIPLNDLGIQGYSFSPAPCQSTAQYISQRRKLLHDFYQMPTPALDQKTAELEMFALHVIDQIPLVVEDQAEPSVLTHTDLRWSNILVDEELHIVGIIDWEWASTVPVSLFTPPSWITTSEDHFSEFRSVLSSMQTFSPHSHLLEKWKCEYTTTSRLAEIYQKPHHLVDIFYRFIYPKLFTRPREDVVRDHFLCASRQSELQRLLQGSERYTKYLKDNDLFVEESIEQQLTKEWMAKVQAFFDAKKNS